MKSLRLFVLLVLLSVMVLALLATMKAPSFSFDLRPAPSRRPNIVFIMADDLGWRDIGYHGAEFPTPNLDALAESGVKLENYYVQPTCAPTRGQLMTGRYQIHTGLQSVTMRCTCRCGLPLQYPTLADKLRELDYATHIVGKWHLGFYKRDYLPTHRGFDSHFGYYKAGQDYYNHSTRGALDFHYNEKPLRNATGYSTELFRDRAIQIMKNHVRDTPSKPLFMYLAFQAVHAPLQVPDRYTTNVTHIEDYNRRIHAGMTVALDEAVAKVKAGLVATGLWHNTLVIFSTDNGGQPRVGGYNWPLRGSKGTYWEGGLRGAAFVSGPALARGGATSHELLHVSDWYPTLINFAGGNTSGETLDGYNIWPTLRDGVPTPRTEVLHNIDSIGGRQGNIYTGSPFDNRLRAALRVDSWKILTGSPGDTERTPLPGTAHPDQVEITWDAEIRAGKNIWLFNIAEDPEERHDLSADRPDIVMMMLEKLAEYDKTAVAPLVKDHNLEARPPPGGVWGPWDD